MATTKKRKSKGKRHPAHAASFKNIADHLRKHALNPQVDLSDNRSVLLLIADVFEGEGERVSKILR